MSTVLFLVNHEVVIYNFRLEIVERLLADGNRVVISSPGGERIEELKKMGCVHEPVNVERHGKNPFKDLVLIATYRKLIERVKPDVVFAYTIKPNIYGSLAAKSLNVPCVTNITGLGTAVENGGILSRFALMLYKYAFRSVQRVFYQNEENEKFFLKNHIAEGKQKLIPGSGVNLSRFVVSDYPEVHGEGRNKKIRFLFISRIMKEKGIDEYLKAAAVIKKKYPDTEFHVCGFCEENTDYPEILKRFSDRGIIEYHGMIRDVNEFLQNIHCVILPTYYPEGISNVLLESCACARPIISTDRPGSREVLDDGSNGFFVREKDPGDLVAVIEKFMDLSYEKMAEMGMRARRKVEKEFDRQIVVDAYIEELEKATGLKKRTFKDDIQYIRAKESGWDYCFEGIRNMGYNIMIPYRDKNLLLRLLREAWFRSGLPFRKLWYNPGIRNIDAPNIIVKDPLITQDFVEYLRKLYPEKKIILEYDNRVSNSKKNGLDPAKLGKGVAELWSYDSDDCDGYSMNKKREFYLDIYRTTDPGCEKQKDKKYKYDVLYLGRDKGRADEILKYRRLFRKMGLKTHFHICADRSMFAEKKTYYRPKIRYTDYLKLESESRAILNIMPEGQYSITPRDMEAAFNNVKEITNNRGVKNLEFYSPQRYFILGEDDIKGLKGFLYAPLIPVSEEVLQKYTFDRMVLDMVMSDKNSKD
ncbi:MAG: glycosyltransferase family 4 protein [Lachnospiraceae bacterium]|nr:glycosyltransferase family 4 protein [Lachnospiraceae bacterium]